MSGAAMLGVLIGAATLVVYLALLGLAWVVRWVWMMEPASGWESRKRANERTGWDIG